MHRLFTGLDVPADIAAELALMQGGIEGARWTHPADFHLTLTFLGDVASEDLPDLDAALSSIRADDVEFSLSGTGSFAQGKWPNVLWMGVSANSDLSQLKNAVDSALRQTSIDFEKRNYAPHVTMARLRRAETDDIAGFMQQYNLYRSRVIRAESFFLYESLPGRGRGEQKYVKREEYFL